MPLRLGFLKVLTICSYILRLKTRPRKLHQTSHAVALDTGAFSLQSPPNFIKITGMAGGALPSTRLVRLGPCLRPTFLGGFVNIDMAC